MAARNRTLDILGKALNSSNINFCSQRNLNFDIPEWEEENEFRTEINSSCIVSDQTVEAEHIAPEEVFMCESEGCYDKGLIEKTSEKTENLPTSPLRVLAQMTNVGPLDPALSENRTEELLPVEHLSAISCTSESKVNKNDTSGTKKKRKAKQNKQYFDYYLSEEDFTSIFGDDIDSDTYIPTTDSSGSDNATNNSNKKRTKKTIKDTENLMSSIDQLDPNIVGDNAMKPQRKNKKKERQKLKRSGRAYTRHDGTEVPAKELKQNPCIGKKCGNDCGSVTDEKRQSIHTYFWNLSVTRHRDWLVSMTQKTAIKRKRSKDSDKRSFTYKYTITEGEGKRPVCLQFLAATLDVGLKFIQYTVQNSEFGVAKEDNRGRCDPHNKTKDSTLVSVMNFIKSLPAVPSHYCRKDSSRVYLPSELKNLANLYKIYKKTYIEKGIDIVSERVFRSIFNEKFNIGFHVPKKDKCLKCLKFEQNIGNPEIEEERQQHELEKNRKL